MRHSLIDAPRQGRAVFMLAAASAVVVGQFVGSALAAQAPRQRTTAPVEETRLSNIRDAAGLFTPKPWRLPVRRFGTSKARRVSPR